MTKKKLPGEEVPTLFFGLLSHHDGQVKLKALKAKAAHSSLKTHKTRAKTNINAEEN